MKKIKTNNGMYGIVVGKNNDLKNDFITAKLMRDSFTSVAGEKVFAKY